MNQYLVLSRGQWDPQASPQQIQDAIDRFYAWHERMVEAGRMKPGQRLARESKLVTRHAVTDGPFSEAKEVVGGYWTILAPSLEEAARLAAENPCLAFGLALEVRPIDEQRCSAFDLTCETPPSRAR
ncbi:YciI family protein [Piscinibacter sp. XHJ-5]|uniref:YciI family protein n=1 Tax=Piscinibacter sp. XHJ-5 TaxID=3037797 RepID=UPI002453407C|nr:YciI family protein [Piscinibacter sp. XHJ-5]